MGEGGFAIEFNVFAALVDLLRDGLPWRRAYLLHILHNAAIKHLKIVEIDK